MKKRLVRTAAMVLLSTPLLWSLGGQSAWADGASIYQDKCALCHGAGGDGKGPGGAALNPKPTDFTDPKYWQTASDQKIKNDTLNGVGVMPASDLNTQDMQALLDYLKTFKK
ncbi:MAG: c-type cytochrome [Thermodesulfobacteriota bacterium]